MVKRPRVTSGDRSCSIEVLERTVRAHTGPVTPFIHRSGVRCHPSRCAECAGASGDGRDDACKAQVAGTSATAAWGH